MVAGVVMAVVWAATVQADSDVLVTAEVDANAISSDLSVGQVITIPLTVSGEGPAAICAVDVELTCKSDDLRLLSVTFAPEFSTVLEEHGVLPGPSFRAVRAQSLHSLDRVLATDGQVVPLATVKVEVLGTEEFASGLEVNVQAATIGRARPVTFVRSSEDAEPERTGSSIPIRDTGPAMERPEPWTVEPAALSLEVRPVGSDRPVDVLAPNTTYELHCVADASYATCYILFAVARSTGTGIAAAAPPPSGNWSDTGLFYFLDLDGNAEMGGTFAAEGYPRGYYIRDMVTDDVLSYEEFPPAASGHLCNFTTPAAGELNLQLFVWSDDVDTRHMIEMEANAHFRVAAPGVTVSDD